MLFSPICWNHYIVYLFPMWGWLAWELLGGGSWIRSVAAALAIAFATVQTNAYPPLTMPEPYNSHIMASLMLVLALGVARLAFPGSGASVRGNASPASAATSSHMP